MHDVQYLFELRKICIPGSILGDLRDISRQLAGGQLAES